ncbi:MAG: T9SS type A sorting domain-containing protein [Ignavibacteriales bacterium]|nr:T9SS type A sorting domain-containing protein [Ignavibacteriales bacterium]
MFLSGDVNLSVFNSLGEKVVELVNGVMEAGNHKVEFNAANLPSGIYFYKISSGNFNSIKKMVLLK